MMFLLWKRALLLVAAALLGLYSLFSATTADSLHSLPALDRLAVLGKNAPRVAILEPTRYHAEVFGALLHILRNIGVEPQLYRESGNWTELGALLAEPEPAFIEDAAGPIERGEFDAVVVNTCDDKFWGTHQAVWAALGKSEVKVLCTMHELEWLGPERAEPRAHLSPLRDQLSMLTLGAHTARAMRDTLRAWARAEREWERVPVHHYAPVFDLPPAVRRHQPPARRVRNAGVLGRIAQGNRDYVGLLGDLERSMLDDPLAWGYTLEGGRLVRQADAFTLHLVGMKEGDVPFPPALVESGAVRVHAGVDTFAYYRLIGEMDIVLPSFANDQYTTKRASASVPAAVMAQTPLLATHPIAEAYAYLDSGSYVLRPLGMRAVEALKLLRAGEDPWAAAFGEGRREKHRWWSPSTLRRIQKDNERLFRGLLYN